jgi:hypothetical protein
MRTETITIYTFDELSDAAKETAREFGRQIIGSDFAWSEESLDSIRQFCDEFGVSLKSWSIGPYEPVEFATDADNGHFRGRKLSEFSRDAMPNGYCLDCALWETFFDEFKRTGSAKSAFESAIYAGFTEWRDDMESQLEDEYIDDFLTANEYEFDEDGNLY